MSEEPEPQDKAWDLRNLLVKELVSQGAVTSQPVRQAFEEVPRHLFVPRVSIATAYSNRPIFIRWEAGIPISSSSEPKMMAIMMEQMNWAPGSRVLEIGAGTGYNAAILAHVVGEKGSVVTMDIDQDIVDEAAGNLSKAGYGNVKVLCGDGFEGFPGDRSYDRITVTVGAYDISPHWVDQLAEGGVMVVPLWFKGYCLSVALEKHKGELRSLSANPCLFIPIRGERQPTEGYFPIGDPPDEYLQMTIGLEEDDPDLRRVLGHLFNQNVSVHGAGRSLEGQFHTQNLVSGLYMFLTVDPSIFNVYSASHGGPFRGFGYGLIDVERMSAAVISDRDPERVVVYGDDAAYDRLIDLLDKWDQRGRPSVHDLQISALFDTPESVPDGQWILAKRSAYTWAFSWGT